MSEKTAKLDGWTPYARPPEDDDMKFHRQLITKIIFGLYQQKKEKLKEMGFPSQPISLREIWLEFQSRREMLDSIKQWPWKWHEKRWIDRRVNEVACPKYAENGNVKIVSPKADLYEPNPALFQKKSDPVKRDCSGYRLCLTDQDWRPEHCVDCHQYLKADKPYLEQ